MKLYRMQASFGCLDGETLVLEEGFNLLTAPNESGKSTWCAFLLAMLYGLNTRERDSRTTLADKNRYRPFSGAPMEGLLECDYEGRRVVLRRQTVGALPMGSFSAVWAESGLCVEGLTAENVGLAVTGVTRDLFERSVLFRQNSLAVEQNEALEQRIEALLSSGDETQSWSQADARLREWQRRRRHNKSGELPQLEAELTQLRQQQQQMLNLQAERDRLALSVQEIEQEYTQAQQESAQRRQVQRKETEAAWNEAAAQLDAAAEEVAALRARPAPPRPAQAEATSDRYQTQIEGRKRQALVLCALVLLLGLGLILLSAFALLRPLLCSIAFALLLLAAGLALLFLRRRNQEDRAAISQLLAQRRAWEQFSAERGHALSLLESRESESRAKYLTLTRKLQDAPPQDEALPALALRLATAQREQALLEGRADSLGDMETLEAALLQHEANARTLEREYAALSLALSALKSADAALRERFAPALNELASRYFCRLSDGAYQSILLARDFSAQTSAPNTTALRSSLHLSQGTLDQLYFSLRLSISELLLPEGSTLPFLLDDALAAFDDARAARALALLHEQARSRQILFFSCQAREAALLTAAGLSFHALPGTPSRIGQKNTALTPKADAPS